MENQMAVNKTMNEILEHRRKTNAEIRHEDYLMLTGQEEYKNPYTGDVETGSSAYSNRWQNSRGDVLYSDENSFDPNQTETKTDTEWKRSEVWDRNSST
jgi:hypothetical protein